MFVGDVRCATLATGCSWQLSGGSQWSSGPTKVSKNAQVLRASLRRKMRLLRRQVRFAARERTADPPRDAGRDEPEQRGSARRPPSAGGRDAASASVAAMAMTGAIHIDLTDAASPDRPRGVAAATRIRRRPTGSTRAAGDARRASATPCARSHRGGPSPRRAGRPVPPPCGAGAGRRCLRSWRGAGAAAPRPACATGPGRRRMPAGAARMPITTSVHSHARGKHGPAEQQQRRQRRRDEAAPQVVEELPLRQRGQRIRQPAVAGSGHARQQPARELPVAANPAVPAADVRALASTDTPRTAARRSAARSARSSPRAGRG